MQGISWVAEDLLASQEELCSTEFLLPLTSEPCISHSSCLPSIPTDMFHSFHSHHANTKTLSSYRLLIIPTTFLHIQLSRSYSSSGSMFYNTHSLMVVIKCPKKETTVLFQHSQLIMIHITGSVTFHTTRCSPGTSHCTCVR